MENNRFNIRVYGLMIDDGKVLVTDEFRLGIFMTKFPGGGLQFGEGTIDCLKREFREELNLEIEVQSHFYTTDFFQLTELLSSDMQLISIYYLVGAPKPYRFPTTKVRDDIPAIDGVQCFRWVKIDDLSEKDFTFPVDKYVAEKLKNE
ncbi:MAG: NUDIX domain-containing protein [Bacteroidales bacterium]|jgi:ADP-ribose pyrophosphatase YjhB (NUDIX family)|nr:NUDIX domain-containing protein [Bacteroidales bacterium]